MISITENDSPQLRKRYRPLAGPFEPQHAVICEALLAHLTGSQARVLAANERGGITIFRLRSECETLEQTAIRLRKQKRR